MTRDPSEMHETELKLYLFFASVKVFFLQVKLEIYKWLLRMVKYFKGID